MCKIVRKSSVLGGIASLLPQATGQSAIVLRAKQGSVPEHRIFLFSSALRASAGKRYPNLI